MPQPVLDRFPAQPREQTDRQHLLRLCEIQLWGSVLVSRLAVPLGGGKQIQATWIFAFICFMIIGVRAGWAVSGRRLAGLACIVLATIFESFYIHHDYSTFSLVYLFGIYGPLCLTLPSMTGEELREIWQSYIKLVIFLSCCGLLQLMVQFV